MGVLVRHYQKLVGNFFRCPWELHSCPPYPCLAGLGWPLLASAGLCWPLLPSLVVGRGLCSDPSKCCCLGRTKLPLPPGLGLEPCSRLAVPMSFFLNFSPDVALESLSTGSVFQATLKGTTSNQEKNGKCMLANPGLSLNIRCCFHRCHEGHKPFVLSTSLIWTTTPLFRVMRLKVFFCE